MSARKWTAVPMIAGVLTGHVPLAAAQDPAPPPPPQAAAPVPALPAIPAQGLPKPPVPEPGATPPPKPVTPEDGSVVYITTTTTTTTVNAPIIVVAAPITSTTNMTSPLSESMRGVADRMRERFVVYMTGCGRPGSGSPDIQQEADRSARVRLARNATLVVRVNGRRVATLRLPSTPHRRAHSNALRLRLAPNGMLTIRRPSGRVLAAQGCTPT